MVTLPHLAGFFGPPAYWRKLLRGRVLLSRRPVGCVSPDTRSSVLDVRLLTEIGRSGLVLCLGFSTVSPVYLRVFVAGYARSPTGGSCLSGPCFLRSVGQLLRRDCDFPLPLPPGSVGRGCVRYLFRTDIDVPGYLSRSAYLPKSSFSFGVGGFYRYRTCPLYCRVYQLR